MRIAVRQLIAAAATTSLVIALPPAASAAPGNEVAALQDAMARLTSGPLDESETNAGYAKTGSFDMATTESIVVPDFDCTGTTQDVLLIGHASPSRDATAGVLNVCFIGYTVMIAQVGGVSSEFVPVDADDVLEITTTRDGATMTITVTNTTTEESVTATGPFADDTFIIGAISEPGMQIADFGKVKVKKSAIDGKTIKKRGLTRYDMAAEQLRVKTSKIKRGSFTLTHKSL